MTEPNATGMPGPLKLRETVNFWLTNRLPRNLLTRFMGWYSRIESPLLAQASIAVWRRFVDDLALEEAEQEEFASLHACFVRRLKPGARPIDPDPNVLVSPCDAEIGALGRIEGRQLFQAKGLHYSLDELLGDDGQADVLDGGSFVTLRLKSSMYHRFHAPARCRLAEVHYIAGEVFNVNPPTLRRLPGVFVRNERAVLSLDVAGAGPVLTLVPVAAILVGSLRLGCLDAALDRNYPGPSRIPCGANFERGEEMGWFEHGSTIIALARAGVQIHPGLQPGQIIRVGQPLLVTGNG